MYLIDRRTKANGDEEEARVLKDLLYMDDANDRHLLESVPEDVSVDSIPAANTAPVFEGIPLTTPFTSSPIMVETVSDDGDSEISLLRDK